MGLRIRMRISFSDAARKSSGWWSPLSGHIVMPRDRQLDHVRCGRSTHVTWIKSMWLLYYLLRLLYSFVFFWLSCDITWEHENVTCAWARVERFGFHPGSELGSDFPVRNLDRAWARSFPCLACLMGQATFNMHLCMQHTDPEQILFGWSIEKHLQLINLIYEWY